VRCDELLAQTVAADQCGVAATVAATGEDQAIVAAQGPGQS
jgi:hypothetical protein